MKTTTETREAVSKLIVDCLITGDAERTAEKVEYGNPDYWTDQIMQLIAKEKQDLLKRVEKEVIGNDEGTRTWHRFFKGSGFEKSNSKHAIDIKCAYTNGYNFAKAEQRKKLAEMKEGKGEK